jgi:hypothetical protein
MVYRTLKKYPSRHNSTTTWPRLARGPRAPERCAGLLRILVSIVLTCVALQHVHAAQVIFRWDYDASGAAGFVLHCGLSSGSYVVHLDVGNTDTYTLNGLLENRTYYCAVTAYDPGKVESDYSNQISYIIPTGADGSATKPGLHSEDERGDRMPTSDAPTSP